MVNCVVQYFNLLRLTRLSQAEEKAGMTSTFSAAPQALGYLYQIEIALYLLIKENGGEAISIEHIDDVAFHDEKGTPTERLQIKHHKNLGSLSDAMLQTAVSASGVQPALWSIRMTRPSCAERCAAATTSMVSRP